MMYDTDVMRMYVHLIPTDEHHSRTDTPEHLGRESTT
jgi:hypothetical protein